LLTNANAWPTKTQQDVEEETWIASRFTGILTSSSSVSFLGRNLRRYTNTTNRRVTSRISGKKAGENLSNQEEDCEKKIEE